MNDNIKAALTDFVNLTEEEWSVFSATLVTKQYKKGDYFLKENDYCDYVGFVNKGFFNFFYLIKGVEHIRGFFTPNSFISNYPSFLLKNKSKFYIQALEDSSVTLIHRDALFLLYKKLPKVQELSRSIVENLYIEVSEKYESFFLKTAEERYLDLLISEPKVIEKIPQFMIASYLGVSPEGLSRIKNRIAKK
ncbi:Crp/Fnr family transcriptional regulator [Flavobacteriaceae bacterium]|nr:Crp/Fnr family transcriptional regulator [Flavobacteriaceae bacterium]